MPTVARTSAFCNSENINHTDKQTYRSLDIVDFYVKFETLQPAEQAILNLLRKELPTMSMLDVGVGGGRTTTHFSPLVKQYLGIDYSPEMVQACRNKFPNRGFEVVDVRDLSMFAENQFDFTLFSNNGLDYINHEDRIKALKEIHRVTHKQGIFCMSTHNLNSVPELLKFNLADLHHAKSSSLKNRLYLLKSELHRVIRIWVENKVWLKNPKKETSLLFNDGVHEFRLITYYVKPEEQIKLLRNVGFGNIRIIGTDGKEISFSNLATKKDSYLYFLCTLKGN